MGSIGGGRATAFLWILGCWSAVSGIYGQGLTPSFPTKEYVYLGGQVIAIENSPLKDVSNSGFESGSLSSWPLNLNGSVASVTNTVLVVAIISTKL